MAIGNSKRGTCPSGGNCHCTGACFIVPAMNLFEGSKPLVGKEYEYLEEALRESSVSKPTLPDRL